MNSHLRVLKITWELKELIYIFLQELLNMNLSYELLISLYLFLLLATDASFCGIFADITLLITQQNMFVLCQEFWKMRERVAAGGQGYSVCHFWHKEFFPIFLKIFNLLKDNKQILFIFHLLRLFLPFLLLEYKDTL